MKSYTITVAALAALCVLTGTITRIPRFPEGLSGTIALVQFGIFTILALSLPVSILLTGLFALRRNWSATLKSAAISILPILTWPLMTYINLRGFQALMSI